MITKDLGAVSAYAYAVEKGYTGTEAEYAELMASYATVAQQAGESAQTATTKAQQASASATSASQSADTASASATSASQSATTATAKASEAQQSATTATTKAQEALQSASTAFTKAQEASQSATDAESAKTASETAQAIAESARDDAETARDEAQQYAESIDPQKLIGAYPVDTASGSIASFTDGADNIPMKKVTVRIEPKQDLHGQDTPYPAGGGKNLLETTATSKTENGITFTVNPDGSVLVNGTATEQANFLVNPDGKLIPAGTQITVSGCPANGSMDTYSFWATTQTYLEHGNGITFTPSEDTLIIGRIRIAKGCVCNNLLFKPQVEKGSAKTSWSPYSNICPISGWEEVKVSHSGINIFNKATAVQNCYINNSEDGLERESTGSASTNYIPVKPNTSYYIVTEQQRGQWGAWYDGEKNYISGITGYGVLTAPSNAQFMRLTTVYVLQGVKYGNLDTFSINYPSTDHDYHPYSGNPITIPLPQTVYGGTLDVTTGELVVDRAMVDLGTLTWAYNASYKFFRADLDGKANGRTNLIASSYAYGDVWDTSTDYIAAGHTGTNAIYVKDSRYTDASAFKSAMSGVQLCYELATPIALTLSPAEIKSLLGDNNIWADTGDSTVTYRADTTLYINRKIAEAISALS